MDDTGRGALHHAALGGYAGVIEELLAAGARAGPCFPSMLHGAGHSRYAQDGLQQCFSVCSRATGLESACMLA